MGVRWGGGGGGGGGGHRTNPSMPIAVRPTIGSIGCMVLPHASNCIGSTVGNRGEEPPSMLALGAAFTHRALAGSGAGRTLKACVPDLDSDGISRQ